MSDTPAPTDPREEMIPIQCDEKPCVHEWYQGSCVHCEIPVKVFRQMQAIRIAPEQSTKCGKCGEHKQTPWRDNEYGYVCLKCLAEGFATNSKLAAEIAELKEQVTYLKAAGEGLQMTIRTERERRDVIIAELEAARKELHSKELQISALNNLNEGIENENDELRQQRDTALAAKDAAEKLPDKWDVDAQKYAGYWDDARIDAMQTCARDLRAALTPAPTQEPPAGGVTLCDSSGVEDATAGAVETELPVNTGTRTRHPSNSVEMSGPITREAHSESSASPAVTPSPSPADVPSEGRGEWMLIETAPKDGRSIILFRGGYVRIGYWDDQKYHSKPRPFWNDIGHLGVEACRRLIPTHWQPLPPPPMLPPEGSGA